jgi:hypothetical protein
MANAGEKLSICGVPYFMPIVTLCMAKTFGNPWGRLNRPFAQCMKSKTDEM